MYSIGYLLLTLFTDYPVSCENENYGKRDCPHHREQSLFEIILDNYFLSTLGVA